MMDVEAIKDDGVYDLAALARCSGLSVSTLRRWTQDPAHPLPTHHVRSGGKASGRVLVLGAEFRAWVRSFPATRAVPAVPVPTEDRLAAVRAEIVQSIRRNR